MDPVATRRVVSPVFGQLYVSVAVLAFAALFVPLYAWGEPEYSLGFADPAGAASLPPLSSIVTTSRIDSYSLWQGIVSYGETVALLATALILAYVGVAIVAAVRRQSVLAPVLVLVLGIAGIVFLVVNPDSPAGAVTGTGLGMLWGASLVALATSAVHLYRLVRAPQA